MPDTIENPLTGYTITFLEATEEVFRFREVSRPGFAGPPPHVHPFQEERFEVLRGTIHFSMEGKIVSCEAGATLVVPIGVSHTFVNPGPAEFEMIAEYRPGLPAVSRRFHEVYFALARAGKTNAAGMPNLLQIAVEMPLVSDHVRLTSPPWSIQRLLLAALRPLARMLGYRPFELPGRTTPVSETVPVS